MAQFRLPSSARELKPAQDVAEKQFGYTLSLLPNSHIGIFDGHILVASMACTARAQYAAVRAISQMKIYAREKAERMRVAAEAVAAAALTPAAMISRANHGKNRHGRR